MHRLGQTIVIADELERMIGTGLATATDNTTETTEEEEAEEEETRTVRRIGRKKDVWAEIHTAALAQEQARRAPSSSKAEGT